MANPQPRNYFLNEAHELPTVKKRQSYPKWKRDALKKAGWLFMPRQGWHREGDTGLGLTFENAWNRLTPDQREKAGGPVRARARRMYATRSATKVSRRLDRDSLREVLLRLHTFRNPSNDQEKPPRLSSDELDVVSAMATGAQVWQGRIYSEEAECYCTYWYWNHCGSGFTGQTPKGHIGYDPLYDVTVTSLLGRDVVRPTRASGGIVTLELTKEAAGWIKALWRVRVDGRWRRPRHNRKAK